MHVELTNGVRGGVYWPSGHSTSVPVKPKTNKNRTTNR